MITVIKGDITTCSEGVIAHQVNCKGVMGSGVARSLRSKYPNIYKAYMESNFQLGSIQFVGVANNLVVANMFSQFDYGRDKSVVYTNYVALQNCLRQLYKFASLHNLQVVMPYNIGCGLANGDWNKVYNLIKLYDDKFQATTMLYKL